MKRVPYRKYTKEFRVEAVKLVIDGDLSIPEVGKRLSVSPSTLSTWVKAYRTGLLEEVGKNHRQMSEKEMEVARLKRELAEARMECDILKKAAVYFAKGSQ